jgi:delta 1-pyrroline-5-carboxylate dehydrogenase
MARLFLFVSWVFILAIYGGGVAVAGETGDEPAATPATDTAIASEGVPPPPGGRQGKAR